MWGSKFSKPIYTKIKILVYQFEFFRRYLKFQPICIHLFNFHLEIQSFNTKALYVQQGFEFDEKMTS